MALKHTIICAALAASVPVKAATIILKCSLEGEFKSEITYILNTSQQGEMTVIGEFGSHQAKSFLEEPFLFVLEPNKNASVTTMIYIEANEIPYAIRTTFGLLPEKYNQNLQPYSKDPLFLTVIQKGYCPIQR